MCVGFNALCFGMRVVLLRVARKNTSRTPHLAPRTNHKHLQATTHDRVRKLCVELCIGGLCPPPSPHPPACCGESTHKHHQQTIPNDDGFRCSWRDVSLRQPQKPSAWFLGCAFFHVFLLFLCAAQFSVRSWFDPSVPFACTPLYMLVYSLSLALILLTA